MHLQVDHYASPLGEIVLSWDLDENLRALDFADYRARMERLLKVHYGSYTLTPMAAPVALRAALDAYFAGDVRALERVRVSTEGTPFQREVWRALRTIPAGTTMSYGSLAAQLGRPGSARAVGTANRENPVGIVVPCHRVIGAQGTLTGYAGGMERKRWLLAHEAGSTPQRFIHGDRPGTRLDLNRPLRERHTKAARLHGLEHGQTLCTERV
jgi:O-6-methylguanine DNA methyltransferase